MTDCFTRSSIGRPAQWLVMAAALLSFNLAACGTDSAEDDSAAEAVPDADNLDPPEGFCLGVSPEVASAAVELPLQTECPTCIGADPPGFVLQDLQPLSCSAGETYGISAFRGTTTVVTLLSGRCPFCQAQTLKMEQLRNELEVEGIAVQFVIINWSEAAAQVGEFIERVPFPILQDTAEVNAWGLYGGAKDDLFVYGPDGRLSAYTSPRAETPYNLSTEEGYTYLRQIIVDAAQGIPTETPEAPTTP
jgi:hypothetical protein